MGKTLRGPILRRRTPPAAPAVTQPPFVLETYRLIDGDEARRYWALPGRILVGGRIMSRDDADGLRRKYGVTHVLSAESEQSDETSWLDPATRARCPFPDDAQAIPIGTCVGAIAYTRSVLAQPDAVLYCHCRLGGSRGPTYGYMALRVLGRTPEEAEEQCGRRQIHKTGLHPAYVRSIETALQVTHIEFVGG